MNPILELKHLVLTTPDRTRELCTDINLTVYAGERLAVLGEEGSGKGVLLRVMAGLTVPIRGEILFKGRPLRIPGGGDRIAPIGVLFRFPDPYFLTSTVREEIVLAPVGQGLTGTALQTRVAWAMEVAGVATAWEYRSLLQLSDAERCRVAWAAVLAAHPGVVLADEPGSLLGEKGEMVLAEQLLQVCRELNMGMITLTSRTERAQRFGEKVLRLEKGRVIPFHEWEGGI
ncbi:MAG: energy-coupling factor ABC transporter ATP-binding protein [Magnetococcus sp. DMHC-6]